MRAHGPRDRGSRRPGPKLARSPLPPAPPLSGAAAPGRAGRAAPALRSALRYALLALASLPSLAALSSPLSARRAPATAPALTHPSDRQSRRKGEFSGMIPGHSSSRRRKRRYLGPAAAESLSQGQLRSSPVSAERLRGPLARANFSFLLLRYRKDMGQPRLPLSGS